jgi:tRNA G18 (ribose-2'-O)-methylase SpoU
MKNRGYYGIGIENSKTKANIGTLWRSAYSLGASFIFVVGNRYKHQASDTVKAMKHIPMYHYDDLDSFYQNIPHGCQLIGVDNIDQARDVIGYDHPERAVYLLGAEDSGLSKNAIEMCHSIIKFDSEQCLNVSVAGSIIMYDRATKQKRQ